MQLSDFTSALMIPFVAIYHNVFVGPRFKNIEKKIDSDTDRLARIETDIKWIVKYHKKNGG